jgi:hypothetical protein
VGTSSAGCAPALSKIANNAMDMVTPSWLFPSIGAEYLVEQGEISWSTNISQSPQFILSSLPHLAFFLVPTKLSS